eukprot:gene16638-19768_t
MTLVLPAMIKMQLAKDIGIGLIVGIVPGMYFKHKYIDCAIRDREAYYAALDKLPINDEAL